MYYRLQMHARTPNAKLCYRVLKVLYMVRPQQRVFCMPLVYIKLIKYISNDNDGDYDNDDIKTNNEI